MDMAKENYRTIDTCVRCEHCVVDAWDLIVCNADGDMPCVVLKNEIGSVKHSNKILTYVRWQRKHFVDENGICDSFENTPL